MCYFSLSFITLIFCLIYMYMYYKMYQHMVFYSCFVSREGRMSDFPIGPDTHYRPHLGESLVLNCVPPTSVPKPEILWVLRTHEGNFEDINLNNRLSMDLEGLYLVFSDFI
jgi:hypothetical protein